MVDSGTSSSATSSSQASPAATFVPLLDVASLPPFNSKEDPNTLAVRWKLWKRLFNLYLVAKGITKVEQKTGLLLHTGGLNLQELYGTLLTGADIKPFAESMELLDNYFTPQLNAPFERHQFRQMEQASGESVDQFVCRLRQKVISCEFENVDVAIRDQLIEKCKDPSLRSKFLEKANVTLKDLQDLARVQEAVNMQVKVMDQSSGQVNAVSGRPHGKGKGKRTAQVGVGPPTSGSEVDLKIGGVMLPAKDPIEVIGTFVFETVCEISGISCVDELIVVKGPGRPLLGKNTAEKLGVLRVGPDVCSLTTEGSDADIHEKYREVFTGVGKLKDFLLKLHIKDDVKPVAQPVRRLPFGLRAKVDKKSDELLAKDIIEEVSHNSTEWVSPLFVVPKTDGDIQICVDKRGANSAIERERHSIPTIKEVLYDLKGSTVFSKLDLKWSFHQVELDERSRDIITFVTHRGLYRYKRLMFGVTSVPEKYQKIVANVLHGCEGVANMADDLIVHGCGIKEHDRNLQAILTRLKDKGLTLNGDKCQFRLPELKFFGHDLSRDSSEEEFDFVKAVAEESLPVALTAKQVELASESDPELASLRQYILGGQRGLNQHSCSPSPTVKLV
ncbi:Uncharacterized protein K02A2.6 [Stylophora pistillata]|uniref:Uncharacterized protein K02A2.6 n=1 Tax=Stylophora pistillata TaxID=50429 RepID=A0A2B4SIL5_STYPI|nr:Uncharacterized protein K02A2.6 [Stylophora pistillata]